MTSSPQYHRNFRGSLENVSNFATDVNPIEPVNLINSQTHYLHNFLESYEVLISKLVTSLQSVLNHPSGHDGSMGAAVLDIICHLSDGEFAGLIRYDQTQKWQLITNTLATANFDLNAFKTEFLPTIQPEIIFSPACHGTYRSYEENGQCKVFAVIPMQAQSEAIVVCGLPVDSHLLTDIYGRIIASFYQATSSLIFPDTSSWQHNLLSQNLISLVEAKILDDLKIDLGYVCPSLYERRFKLFCDRLRQMVVYFEPVLHLDPNDLFICGWEALARNPESLCAPSDLFHAAELWGPRFIVELDRHFLEVAAASYRQARPSKQRRASDIMPLSVNVYPESLMHGEYFQALEKIIREGIIAPRNLILEISEKTDLPQFIDGIKIKNPLQAFKARLMEFVRAFGIRFAIDDFGVGYASVSRLAVLNASHIKIDREILFHQPSEIIIKFVHELAVANTLNPARVIVEGIDENSPFSLKLLRQMGVTYIQGHLVGKPEPEIYRLSQEKYLELQSQLIPSAAG